MDQFPTDYSLDQCVKHMQSNCLVAPASYPIFLEFDPECLAIDWLGASWLGLGAQTFDNVDNFHDFEDLDKFDNLDEFGRINKFDRFKLYHRIDSYDDVFTRDQRLCTQCIARYRCIWYRTSRALPTTQSIALFLLGAIDLPRTPRRTSPLLRLLTQSSLVFTIALSPLIQGIDIHP